jgi:hypothetical protein
VNKRMREGAALARYAQQMGLYELVGERLRRKFGGWSQVVLVGGKRYAVGVEPGERVRIAFKQRGTYGHRWYGFVRPYEGGKSWSQEVAKSAGMLALLRYAGLLPGVEEAWRRSLVAAGVPQEGLPANDTTADPSEGADAPTERLEAARGEK